MSTLFDRTSLPLWLWVVILVVGALCILGGIGVVILCMVRRRRAGRSVADMPTRKMTVRRGRVVPASHYLSLTGSKFGLNQYDEDARTNGTRSKSPFEWWSTVKDKRRSHHEDGSHLEANLEPKSTLKVNHDTNQFPRSASSNTVGEKQSAVRVQEVEPLERSPTLQRPARVASFSRPFHVVEYQDHSSSDWSSQTHARNLSMIKESTPRSSVISSRTVERRSSRLSGYNPGDTTRRERRPSSHQSEPQRPSDSRSYSSRPKGGSLRPSPASSNRSSNRSGSSTRPPAKASSVNPVPPPEPAEVLRPIAYRGSRHSLGEDAMTNSSAVSKRSSLVSRHDSLTDYSELARKPSRPKSLILDDAPPQDAGYYVSRAEMMPAEPPSQPTTPTAPARVPSMGGSISRKGNVLRKKSIKRQEVLSYVGA